MGRDLAPALVVLAVALTLTLLAWSTAKRNVEAHESRYFDEAVNRTTKAVDQRMAAYSDILYAVAALFNASELVTRQEFQDYVATLHLVERYPGVHAVGFIRRLRHAEARAFVEQERETHRQNPCGYPELPLFPPTARTEYAVIVLVEPIARNRHLYGVDIQSEPACLEPMRRAAETGRSALSEPIAVIHGEGMKKSVILLLPVYERGRPATTAAERAAALYGFVFAHFLMPDLFEGIFGGYAMPNVDIDLEVFDGEAAPAGLLYDDDRTPRAFATPPSTYARRARIEIGGRPWTLHFESLPSFHDSFYNKLPQLVLAGGLFVSLVLSQGAFLRTRHVQERRRQTAALRFQATHDALTGLPNREHLLARMQATLAHARAGIDRFALLLIDLNGFKEVNDTLGHQSGDRLLQQIGPRLERLVEADEMVARLGGDEFALWVALSLGAGEPGARARQVLEAIQQPFALEHMTVQIDASIGIALYPEHGSDGQTLMRCADVAMYQAKRSHQSHAVYAPEQDPHSPRLLSVTGELGEAMASDQLALHYQPILHIKDRRVIGLEALLRWNHPREGLIPPDEFMPQVERSTLVRPVAHWVIERAVRQCRAWRERGLRTAVAVNISARNLLDSELPDAIARILDANQASPDCLEVEITESAIITDPERALAVLGRLDAAGTGISIDDFGTGYSSLAHLRRLPVSRLKIDRTFVLDMPRDDNDAIIVHSTVNLAHKLGLQVIAEGVEDAEVLVLLEIIGCDCAQGFYLCPPLPADMATEWLVERAARLAPA